jgi:hypothetical protein
VVSRCCNSSYKWPREHGGNLESVAFSTDSENSAFYDMEMGPGKTGQTRRPGHISSRPRRNLPVPCINSRIFRSSMILRSRDSSGNFKFSYTSIICHLTDTKSTCLNCCMDWHCGCNTRRRPILSMHIFLESASAAAGCGYSHYECSADTIGYS